MVKLLIAGQLTIGLIASMAQAQLFQPPRHYIHNPNEFYMTYRHSTTTRVVTPKPDPDSYFFGKLLPFPVHYYNKSWLSDPKIVKVFSRSGRRYWCVWRAFASYCPWWVWCVGWPDAAIRAIDSRKNRPNWRNNNRRLWWKSNCTMTYRLKCSKPTSEHTTRPHCSPIRDSYPSTTSRRAYSPMPKRKNSWEITFKCFFSLKSMFVIVSFFSSLLSSLY